MLYALFWVIPPTSEFYMSTFQNTLYQRECSETLTYKIQTPGNYPE